jgi:hypothetical protein
MKDSTFSKKTHHMLEDNGYSYKYIESICQFNRSSSAAIGVIGVAAFIAVIIVLVIVLDPLYGILAMLLLILGTFGIVKTLVNKPFLLINSDHKTFAIDLPEYNRGWNPVNKVASITLKSKFVSEYTSAFKETSEEHLVTIHLNLDSGRNIMLFKFSSDYAEPTPEINEVYSFLENSFKGKRSLNS